MSGIGQFSLILRTTPVRSTLALLFLLVSTNAFAMLLGPERQLAVTLTEHFVATDDGYVVFWGDGDITKAAHIALDGSISGETEIFRGLFISGAVYDGHSIVAVTQRFLDVTSPVEAVRIAADLSAVGAPVRLGNGPRARIAFDRGEFIVGWQSTTTDGSVGTLVLSRLNANLDIVRQRALDLTPAAHVGDYVLAPGGVGTLVVWNELMTGVRAARLTDDLTIADPGGISVAAEGSSIANAWWNGSEWLIVWSDNRVLLSRVAPSGAVGAPEVLLQSQPRLYQSALAIPLDGKIVVGAPYVGTTAKDPGGFILSSGKEEASLNFGPSPPVQLVAGADGRALLSYHKYPSILSIVRIVDFNAAGGRQRPTR